MNISRFNILKTSIKRYKMGSIFVKNFIIIFLLVIIPLNIISLLFYSNTINSTQQEIYQSNYNHTNTIRNITDNIMKELNSLAIIASSQNDILTYLISDPQPGSINSTQTEVARYCKSFIYTYTYIESIYIYCETTNTVLSDYVVHDFNFFSDNDWFDSYKKTKSDKGKIVFVAKDNYYPYYLSIVQPIFATDIDRMGAIVININIQKLAKLFLNVDTPTEQCIYIINDDNKIIYSENQAEIFCDAANVPLSAGIVDAERRNTRNFSYNGTDYTYSSIKSSLFQWRYVSAVPMSFYSESTTSVTLLLFILFIASLIISAFISFYISISTYKPIGNIVKLISSPEEGPALYSDAPKNESTDILNRISNTLRLNQALKEELDIRVTLLKHAQIVALQSQINPHFLFNTLDTINWMAIDKLDEENDVSDALTTLGDLFKLNIDTSNYLTDLKSEIEYTKKYIEILYLRHSGLFTVQWDIDKSLYSCKIPRLVLQPLIENAIYHGIIPKCSHGLIQVKICSDANQLSILVSDDGVGMAQDRLENLTKEIEQDSFINCKHVGIKNINQRIKLIYGSEFGIKIDSSNGWTTIYLTVPIIE